ncbi:MAG: tetratricopeptide repeat protein [Acidobacteria bacterium]|nr:MAG: tetratricopeptide repeat protein [Acidobacteriota bacterium]REK01703.1 MAG: tetratricopeptide repeat protein [Acidobacteriota bacterium]REK14659.1 MAG: tetratricopeptide repeat protein [Acidobacteriota bacterium]REK45374.1 MAG: tetratricopeptide repeat protein [Acidobacteriota bacterium]
MTVSPFSWRATRFQLCKTPECERHSEHGHQIVLSVNTIKTLICKYISRKEVKMDFRSQLRKSVLTVAVLWAFLLSSLPVSGQVVLPGNIAGRSGKWVVAGGSKKSSAVSRRTSKAKRTRKQRSSTRRQVVRRSQSVAKKNRNRRDINEVTPEEYRRLEAQINRMSPEEASKVFAGAGEYFVVRDEIDEAVRFLEQSVELDGNNKDARLALSEVYTTLGDRALVKADEYAELAAKAVAANDSANETRNSALANTEIEKAEKYYTAGVQNDPSNPSAYVGLGQFYDARDDDSKAKTNYEKALSLDDSLTEVKGPLGIIYYQESLEEGVTSEQADELQNKAEQLIADAVATDPENAESQFFLGLIRYKQGDNENALGALRRSLDIDSENPETHYYLGATYNRLGGDDNVEKAIGEFEKAVALDQRFFQAWFDLGVVYYNKGEFEKAIAAFEKSIEFNADQTAEQKRVKSESYANAAEAYRQANKIDLAISRYRIAVTRIKDDPELFTTYGFAHAERDNWVPAIQAFQTASGLAPDSATATTNLGWAHYKAAESYERRNMKSDMDASLRQADSLLEKAVAQYESVGGSDQNKAAANLYLGVVRNKLGDYSGAEEALEKANALSNERWAAAVVELGISELNLKKFGDAIKHFKQAQDIQPGFPEAMYYHGLAEYKRGDEKEARKIQARLQGIDQRLAQQLERDFFRVDFN